MKYIRTKDGIIDTETKYLNFVSKEEYLKQVKENREGLIVSYIENNVWYCYCESDGCVEWKDDILNQADTIEELCDEFVIEYPSEEFDILNHDYSTRLKYMGMEQYNAEINHGWCKLYGAIWTEKGLIYVAKMNENGELCLI